MNFILRRLAEPFRELLPREGETTHTFSITNMGRCSPVVSASIRAVAAEDWTSTSGPTRYEMWMRSRRGRTLDRIVAFTPVGWTYWHDGGWQFSTDEPIEHQPRKPVYVMEES